MSEKSLVELRTANKFLEEENNKLFKKNIALRERLLKIVEANIGKMNKTETDAWLEFIEMDLS